MALANETAVFATSRGQAAELTVLADGVADPVDTGVVADSSVGGVDKDDFKVLVDGILVNPIRVQDTESTALAADTLLGDIAEIAGGFELSDTRVDGLTVDNTLRGENREGTG